MAIPTMNKLPYGNYKVLDHKGNLMFRCEPKKFHWYIDRGLAKKINEKTIQLLFEPAGRGHIGDEFYLSEKLNNCVVCGSDKYLTKHHVVPKCYKKYFPDDLKNHSSHDVLVLCSCCHEKYEILALSLKEEIASEYNMPVGGTVDIDFDALKAKKAANALILHRHEMPLQRIEELEQRIKDYFNKANINETNIVEAANLITGGNYVYHGQYVVSRITDLNAFVKRWRLHFVKTMKPRNLPVAWDVERDICNINSLK